MTNQSISRLSKVPVREIWETEPRGFTPWLASEENLPLLGEAIGLQLETQSTEEAVGDFRADIVCKSLPDGDVVLVENQFHHTDHTHLGQILTYTAGLDAVTIVWIAERFREEHRAAIDWLNEKTPEDINFFALEIELWRIDSSPAAPKFNVVCKPNEWTRQMAATTRPSSEQANFRWAYWSSFIRQPVLQKIASCTLRPIRKGNLPFPTDWTDFQLQIYISKQAAESAIYLSCRGENRFENFERLQQQQADIERSVGSSLRWHLNESANQAWVVQVFKDLDPSDESDWPRHQETLAQKTVDFYHAINEFVCGTSSDSLPVNQSDQ